MIFAFSSPEPVRKRMTLTTVLTDLLPDRCLSLLNNNIGINTPIVASTCGPALNLNQRWFASRT